MAGLLGRPRPALIRSAELGGRYAAAMDETEQTFACPRCGTDVTERFWGPCSSCRAALVAAVRTEAHQVEAGRYEPAMHVVPNHVATKD